MEIEGSEATYALIVTPCPETEFEDAYDIFPGPADTVCAIVAVGTEGTLLALAAGWPSVVKNPTWKGGRSHVTYTMGDGRRVQNLNYVRVGIRELA